MGRISMTILGSSLKKLKVGRAIASFASRGAVASYKARKDPYAQRRVGVRFVGEYSKRLIDLLDVKTTFQYSPKILPDKNYFMVCNHMSYLDIMVLGAIRPSVFITSVDMRNTFFLGDLAKLGGSFFVNRKDRSKIKEEVAELEDLVANGFDVFLFPEGTSSNGMQGVLPFKRSIFRVPFGAKIPIIPISLRYTHVDGEPFSAKNCDEVTWHSKMTFAPHLNQLTEKKEIKVDVRYLDPVDPSGFKDHGDLSEHMRELISAEYQRQSELTD